MNQPLFGMMRLAVDLCVIRGGHKIPRERGWLLLGSLGGLLWNFWGSSNQQSERFPVREVSASCWPLLGKFGEVLESRGDSSWSWGTERPPPPHFENDPFYKCPISPLLRTPNRLTKGDSCGKIEREGSFSKAVGGP